jgi:hypothetical protein
MTGLHSPEHLLPDAIGELTAEHAREAALLWELLRADPTAEDLRERITAHLDGMLVGAEHGADPLAGLEKPWRGADLFPVAWLQRGQVQAADDDPDGAAAIADAAGWSA